MLKIIEIYQIKQLFISNTIIYSKTKINNTINLIFIILLLINNFIICYICYDFNIRDIYILFIDSSDSQIDIIYFKLFNFLFDIQ